MSMENFKLAHSQNTYMLLASRESVMGKIELGVWSQYSRQRAQFFLLWLVNEIFSKRTQMILGFNLHKVFHKLNNFLMSKW